MSNGELSYNLRQIRQLLNTAFDDIELDALSLDYFPTVYDQFSSGMRKDSKITLLLDHCRRDFARFEKLFVIVSSEKEKTFKQFEPFLRAAYNDPLLVESPVKTDLSRLFASLREWKLIHNDLHNLLGKLETPFYHLTSYYFSRDQKTINQALFTWKASCVSQLKMIPNKWSLQYASAPELSNLQEKTAHIDDLTGTFQGHLSETELNSLYADFLELRGVLWNVLHVADQHIMILIEDIRSEL